RSDPLGGTTLLMPPASSPQEHEARRRLLQIILDSKPVSTTVARIALALTADGVATLGELLPSPDIGKLRPALLAQAVGQAMTDAKRTALAQLLTQPLSSQELGDALIDLVQAPATELRIELLTTLAERFKPRQLRDRLLALANDTIVALLDLESRCVALPYRHRRALVEALTHHPDPRLQRWASHPHQEEAGARLHTRQSDTVVTLDETLGRRLSRCAAGELPGHLEVVYRQQTRGVCKALMERTSDGGLPVRLEICLAALVSADPLYEIAHVFGRFGATDEGFLAVLREQCVSRCVELRGMSPVAHGWLHGWEDHLTDFGTWAVETAGLDNVLESALVLESPALTWMIWLGVERLIGRWRWRTPSELGDRCPARLDHVLVDVLLGDRSGELYPGLGDTRLTPLIRQRAAKTLVHLHMAGVEPTRVQRSADAIIARLSELDNTLREALEPWIDARGVVRTMQLADTVAPATPEELAVIRRCHDLEALTAWCMSASRTRVEEAAFQLMEMGSPGFARLSQIIAADPPRVRLLVETIVLWPEEAWRPLWTRLASPDLPPRVRHLVGVAALERGAASWGPLLDALCAPLVGDSWFTQADWQTLLGHADLPHTDNLTLLARRLAGSPHYAAYHPSVTLLLAEQPMEEPTAKALQTFLEQGANRSAQLRNKAAWALLRQGHTGYGLPVLLQELFTDGASSAEMLRGASHAEAMTVARSAVMATTQHRCQHEALQLLTHPAVDPATRAQGVLAVLHHTHLDTIQTTALGHLKAELRSSRRAKLEQLSRCFAWGVRRGVELTGRLFSIAMLGGDALGYTRLRERTIHINPLPMLRRERNGERVVRALMLHEFGHHVYHAGPEGVAIWERAVKEKLHSLFNLVADEHLERNLRARKDADGDALKQLAAYAFQHARRTLDALTLVKRLGPLALPVLTTIELAPGRSPGKVQIAVGRVLKSLEEHGSSFGRFVRALRMGLGNRHHDPKVAQALLLFKRRFRHSDLERLYAITVELRDIFGAEVEMLDLIGSPECSGGDPGELTVLTDGMTSDELEEAVQQQLSARSGSRERDNGQHHRTINLTSDATFNVIGQVEPVAYDRSQYRTLARQVIRPARTMREVLRRLGLGYVQQRRRLQGRQLDRARLQSAIVRGDPRMLIARQLQTRSDLFVGILVDCSGSMRINDVIDRARLFATLIAEATAELAGIDVHFWGFTDRVIYDAGSAQRCAAHALQAGGGNNDAAALWHAAQMARRSRRSARLLVMISDGSPTECSVEALRQLVHQLERQAICCAQVAVRPLDHVCFPHYIELLDDQMDTSVARFGQIITRLVRATLRG
ncbi:MAG: hypothetical protein AAFX99_13170, partial [Myxococcota bacterium]